MARKRAPGGGRKPKDATKSGMLTMRIWPETRAMLVQAAKANHRSLQGELRAVIEEAAGVAQRRITFEEIDGRVSRLDLTRRDEAARL